MENIWGPGFLHLVPPPTLTSQNDGSTNQPVRISGVDLTGKTVGETILLICDNPPIIARPTATLYRYLSVR